MGTVIENGTWRARVVDAAATGFRVVSPAEPFVRRMADVIDSNERLFLACRALRKDENCIEANLVVPEANENLETRLCYLNIAVEEGDRPWTPVIQTYGDFDLWDIEAARPWLHAIKALSDEFFEAGWYEDARESYERLLAMDPGDHLTARSRLDRIGLRVVHSR